MKENVRKTLLGAAPVFAILAVTFISFFPSLQNGFTNFDDNRYILDNSTIMFLTPESVVQIFSSVFYTLYHPLTILSYAIERHFWCVNPFPYHLANLCLHMLNCLLLYLLVLRLSREKMTAFIAALWWGIHPLHVESVAWISERKDVLSTFFFLAALLSYLHYMEKGTGRRYVLTLFLFLLSLLAKPMGVTLPVVMIFCDVYEKRALTWRSLGEKIPFFILSALMAWITLHSFSSSVPQSFTEIIGNLGRAGGCILFYLNRFFVPMKCSVIYEIQGGHGPASWLLMLFPGVPALAFIVATSSRRFNSLFIWGISFFLVTLLPVLQVIPNTDYLVADRYTYLPYAGLLVVIADYCADLCSRIPRSSILQRNLCVGCLLIVTVSLATLTWKRSEVWRTSVTLWNNVLEENPGSRAARLNRASGYVEIHDYDRALAEYSALITSEPSSHLYHRRGIVYLLKGEKGMAVADFDAAHRLDGGNAAVLCDRGKAFLEMNEYDRAIADFDRAIEAREKYLDALSHRGRAYELKGETGKSITDYDRALAISPHEFKIICRNTPLHYMRAYLYRGLYYQRHGNIEKAKDDLEKARHIDPRSFPDELKGAGN